MPDRSVDLRKCAALVTGAGAGHGRAIALALAANGASVAVCDINIERAERTGERIRDLGGSTIALQADISNRFQTANMIERTRDAFGKVDILVNATRIYHPEPMLSIDEWSWRRQLEVNITGVFFCLQLMGRVMADEGGGVILNLASAIGLGATLPAGIGYAAGQAAVVAMTRRAARELAPHGIRVNAIAAGGEPRNEIEADGSFGALTLGVRSLGDVQETALYLCSDAAGSYTGQLFIADESDPLSR